jgi:predicted 2-oxoglutarate/Fe(II)-dependent dioxygenase YbiX
MHYDDDVAYRKENKDYDGIPLKPVLGCVYYPEGFDFTGGDLLIYTEGEDKTPEVIKTKPNRLVIFNPGDVAHCVSPVTAGRRGAIAINLWAEEPWSVANGFIELQ